MLGTEAFEKYYREVRPGLLRFISSRVRDPHAARDLVQEVYTKAFRHREKYDETRPFTTWIYTIARNSCVDYLRRRVRDPLSAVAPNAPAAPPDLDTLPHKAPGYDPVVAAEQNDLLAAVREEMRRLPDNRRAALEMKIVESLTYREIAEALGAPLGTVAFWVRESLETIAKRLRHLQ